MDNALNHRNQWALAKYMSTFEIPEPIPSIYDLTVNNGKIHFILFCSTCFDESLILSMV